VLKSKMAMSLFVVSATKTRFVFPLEASLDQLPVTRLENATGFAELLMPEWFIGDACLTSEVGDWFDGAGSCEPPPPEQPATNEAAAAKLNSEPSCVRKRMYVSPKEE
ncbi:MAG: hypothetical protein M3N13_01050, partial [Candidatus Eremiobacteraeota bacterium]|nr:hypothetical protein [Candidatus Eremiobacteraeota bacterium]